MTRIARAPLAMTEAQMQHGVVAHARQAGFLVHFVSDALYRRSFANKRNGHNALDLGDRGFPDLVLVRGDQVLYRELKVGRNTLSEHQEAWRDRLLAAGADWALWRDHQYDDILEMLKNPHE